MAQAYKITSLFGNMTARKDLDVVTDNKLNMSQQSQTAAGRENTGLSYIRRCIVSKTHVIISPPYSALVKKHLENYV